MQPTTSRPFFVIRNSIYNEVVSNDKDANETNGDGVHPLVASNGNIDEGINQKQQARLAIVKLVADSGLSLDFDAVDNEVLIDEINQDSSGHRITHFDARNWRYLITYATLIGKSDILDSLSNKRSANPYTYDEAPCVTLKEDVLDIIGCEVSLQQLFSWDVLIEARRRGDLTWRDIRAFLTLVRGEIPFLTLEGVLKHHEPIHLTFLQFVFLSKLVQYHLEIPPRVKCWVVSISASAVTVRLTSSHKCLVQLCVVPSDCTPPNAHDMQQQNKFVAWKSIVVEKSLSQDILIDSLQPNTNYSIFLRFDRRTVSSSDEDILNSRVDFATDCQANFPDFDSLPSEDQRAELFACLHDITIRKHAPIIPDRGSFISITECSEDWLVFIRWWRSQYDLRSSFLMRELIHAASNAEIRRQANLSGISMKDRMSKDPIVREKWSKRFTSWYFGDAPEAKDTTEDEKLDDTERPPTAATRAPLLVQHYDFESETERPLPQRGFVFKNHVLHAPIGTDEGNQDSDDESNSSEPLSKDGSETTKLEGEIDACEDMNITSIKLGTKVAPKRASPLVVHKYIDVENIPVSNDNDTGTITRVPSTAQKYNHVIQACFVGARIISKRRIHLEQVTEKVQAARTKIESLVGKGENLRGLELFRSKVRLVMLLIKMRPQGSDSVPELPSFDLFDFDEANCDFGAMENKKRKLTKEKPRLRYDPGAAKELRQLHQSKFVKRIFNAMRYWKNGKVAARKEMESKSSQAESAYDQALLKRVFRNYHVYVAHLIKERKASQEDAILEITELETDLEEAVVDNKSPSFEYSSSQEDELASKHRENCPARFRLDPSPFAAPQRRPTKPGRICRIEFESQFHRGIEISRSRRCVYYGGKPIELFTSSALKQLKHEKLTAQKHSGVNIFDVPNDVIAASLSGESGIQHTDYVPRDHVKGLVNMQC